MGPRTRWVTTALVGLGLPGTVGCRGSDAALTAQAAGPDSSTQKWVLDWSAYTSQADLFAGPVGPRQGGRAWPIVLDEAGPWGSTGALQIFFPGGPARAFLRDPGWT